MSTPTECYRHPQQRHNDTIREAAGTHVPATRAPHQPDRLELSLVRMLYKGTY